MRDPAWEVLERDSREALAAMPDDYVSSCVTDPPYGLLSIVKRYGKPGSAPAKSQKDGLYVRLGRGFMGKQWDGTGIERDPTFWASVLRVMKPGAWIFAFGGTRSYHRMATAMEDAGFEIRDSLLCAGILAYTYSSGMPKSVNFETQMKRADFPSEDIERWKGLGTGLKPAWEPIVCARKPIVGTNAQNLRRYGTGGMNLAACRVPTADQEDLDETRRHFAGMTGNGWKNGSAMNIPRMEPGRWPPNLLLVHHALCREGSCHADCAARGMGAAAEFFPRFRYVPPDFVPAFYTSKPGGKEKNRGLGDRYEPDAEDQGALENIHVSVKPVDLMQWLVRLATPPGGIVLDPFCGSGSTGVAARMEGMGFIGIDNDPEYVPIARARIGAAQPSFLAHGWEDPCEEAPGCDTLSPPAFALPGQIDFDFGDDP